MDTAIWAEAHGAATHFPIALVLCSGLLDGAGFVLGGRPAVRDLHAAGYWTMLFGAFGTPAAVLSGLFMTKGGVLGHGALRMHHLFAWPAFALIVGLATWRVLVGRCMARPVMAGYLVGVCAATALVLTAGYWGGELMMAR